MITAQIVSDKVGKTRVKKYEIGDLKSIFVNDTGLKHVTLYPGDYTTWHEDFPSYDADEPVPIPEDVTVTIMPGATVSYSDGYRQTLEDFIGGSGDFYDGPVISSVNHPLYKPAGDTPPTDYVQRYVQPNFTEHIENITDLNLASDWAFKQDLQVDLLWKAKGRYENESGDRVYQSIDIPFRGRVTFDGGNKMKVDLVDLPDPNDEGGKVIAKHVTYDDNESGPDNTFLNNGTSKAIQSLTVDDGHVLDAELLEVVESVQNTDGDLTVSSPKGNITIGHAATGHTDGDGNPVENPTPPSPDPSADPPIGRSVSINAFETDYKGHVENIEYGPNVEEVTGGRSISTSYLGNSANGHKPAYRVSLNANGMSGGSNISITDGGSTIDFSLDNSITQTYQSSDPADPDIGDSVVWVSDGTDSGDTGDYMIKVNVGGTVKQGVIFDYSEA